MSAVCPIFERAGMRVITRDELTTTSLLARLRRARVRPWELMDQARVIRAAAHGPLEDTLRKWADRGSATRKWRSAPLPELAARAGWSATAQTTVCVHGGETNGKGKDNNANNTDASSTNTGTPTQAAQPDDGPELNLDHPPRDPDSLWRWVRDIMKIEVARIPLMEGHSAPMDYLWHAFSEGGDPVQDAVVCDAERHEQPQHAAPPIDCVIWANRGGGKTFMGALATALDLIFKPGIEIRILAGSVEQGRRMHSHLKRFFASAPLNTLVDGNMTERRIRLTNGSEVELLAQSQASVRGTRVQKLRCDEVELFRRDVWDAAQLTTRSKRCGTFNVRGSVECMSTMHVPYGVMHRLVTEAAQGKRRLFKWGVLDVLGPCEPSRACETRAPDGTAKHCGLWEECEGRAKERAGNDTGIGCGHLHIDDALRMKSRVALNTWRSEMLCDRPRRTNCVIEEFDPELHVFDDSAGFESASCMWIGGMDFGFRAPTVVLWACIDSMGTVRVMHERCVTERTVLEHARAIVHPERPKLAWLGIDPAGQADNEQTAVSDKDVLQGVGLTIRAKTLGVHAGLELVRARLKPASGDPPRLLFHRRCTELISCLEKYHYPDHDPETMKPVKDGSDHAIDALRYMIVNLDRPTRTIQRSYLRSG